MADSTKTNPAFDLDIELPLIKNSAKRKIRVGANITFERLHKIIQAAYNWRECHMYQFLLFEKGEQGEPPSVEIVHDKEIANDPKKAKLVSRAKLCDYLEKYKFILYIYDFGDDWLHYIDVVGKVDDSKEKLPILLEGENDAPPEDCGGVEGFADFLEIISKPRHKEYKHMKEWASEMGWERFDLEQVKLRVKKLGKAIVIPPTPPKSKPQNSKQKTSVVPVKKKANVPNATAAKYNEISVIIEKFCDEKFHKDYKEDFNEICLFTLQKLCRKRPSPIERGKPNTWACGIVYAIGSNNFIFDKSQPYSMTAVEIAESFGLSKSTAANKSYEINNVLDISYFTPEYCLKSLTANNPAIWFLKVNGFLIDIRNAPREVQVQAYEQGLIPYIPADED